MMISGLREVIRPHEELATRSRSGPPAAE